LACVRTSIGDVISEFFRAFRPTITSWPPGAVDWSNVQPNRRR